MSISLPAVTPPQSRPRPTFACIRCADRKVKCDRQSPCRNCTKQNVECVFNTSHPTQKRQKRVKDQILTDRLQYYEALLKNHGIDPTKLPEKISPVSQLPSSTTPDLRDHNSSECNTVIPKARNFENPDANEHISRTMVVHDGGRYMFIDNILWTRVVEELEDPDDILEPSSSEESDSDSIADASSYIMNSPQSSNSNRTHPSSESMLQLWRIFLDNVDPLTKLVHVPTTSLAIQKAADNVEAVPRTFETLMFAIYSVAIMSLKDDECHSRFGESRKVLLSRYINGTKHALSRAKFMGTTSLVVLQALILHIYSIRDIYELRSIWSLTGVAVRVAEGMGLERDGTTTGLPPFETEIRRRVWWLLKSHDFRTAELCGLAKFRDLHTGGDSTKWPTNVNDDQLYPGMISAPPEVKAFTDIVFVALRYDLANFAANQIAIFRKAEQPPDRYNLHEISGTSKIEQALKDAEELLEMKYIRYCDPSQALHLMVMITARFSLNVIRFLSHHPRKWASIAQTPIAERQWLLGIAIKLLEQHNMVLTSPQLKQFSWHAPYFQQWHGIIHLLDTLRFNPQISEADKAWELIANMYDHTPSMISDIKKPIHVAVRKLCMKAYHDRETCFQQANIPLPPTPQFILQLREQRETARVKWVAKQAKINLVNLSKNMESTNLQPRTEQPSQQQQNKYDSFWYENGFDDKTLDKAMNMDLDHILPLDQTIDDTGVTWKQWDVWLADSNLISPSAS